MKKLLKEFKEFALRGNVMDMAVGVIVGGAFTAIVTCLTDNILRPILNWIMGNPDEGWTAANAVSAFITAILNFVITAIVLFLILKGIKSLTSIGKKPEAPKAPTTKKCPYCQSEIAIEATRCPHCTSVLEEKE